MDYAIVPHVTVTMMKTVSTIKFVTRSFMLLVPYVKNLWFKFGLSPAFRVGYNAQMPEFIGLRISQNWLK
jgi:hypothetical protein